MKYNTILFDADETLFSFDIYSGIKTTVEKYGLPFGEQDYQRYLAYNKTLWEQYQNNQISAAFLQVERFTALGEQLDIDPQTLNNQFVDNMAEISQPLDGVVDLLMRLKDDFTLGIITNGLSRMQNKRIEKHNMQGWFDCLVVSEEVGEPKPNTRIFEETFKLLGQPEKSGILMVGDTLATDIKGGNQVGIDTVWFQHPNGANPTNNQTDIQPKYTINQFSELADIVY